MHCAVAVAEDDFEDVVSELSEFIGHQVADVVKVADRDKET